jgi:hypothetical protein
MVAGDLLTWSFGTTDERLNGIICIRYSTGVILIDKEIPDFPKKPGSIPPE